MTTIKSERGHKFYWDDKREQFVKDFYGKPGYTSKTIAARLGCSREAVIGKASRLGLTRGTVLGRPGNIRGPVRKQRVAVVTTDRVTLAVTSQNERMGGMGSFQQVLVREVLIDVPGYQCVGVSDIVALEPHQCRWPLDADGFCGNDKYRGLHHNETSYCLVHLKASVSLHHHRGGYWAVHR